MNLEKPDSVIQVSVIHADGLIVGAREHKVAIVVVHDFLNWTLVTSQVYRLHRIHFYLF